MRTAFQGKQFEFMTKEKRRPDVQTIEEMIVQNFSLHMQYANISLFKDMEFMRRWVAEQRQEIIYLSNLISF